MSKIEDKVIDKLMELRSVNFDLRKRIAAKIDMRARIGLAKYGVTLEREDLSNLEWVEHLKEELMDACGYAERLLVLYPDNKLFKSIVQLNIATLISLEEFIDDNDLYE